MRDHPRQQQDDFAVASYQRALEAQQEGSFAEEIAPVEIASRKGTVVVEEDEEPSRFNEAEAAGLAAGLRSGSGTVTAGNASSINDGAAAIVVLPPEKAQQLGVQPQAKCWATPPTRTSRSGSPWPRCAPSRTCEELGLHVADVDLFEINEAFSVVPLAAMKELHIPHEKVNVHGGAVALGHPIGASGTRVLVTLLNALQQRRGEDRHRLAVHRRRRRRGHGGGTDVR